MRIQSATTGSTSNRIRSALALFLVAGLALVFATSPASAQDAVIEGADGDVWEPSELEIEAGTTVTFEMTGGGGGHDAEIDGEEIVPFTPVGESAEHTFNDPGEFTVVCTLHPGMEMELTVAGDAVEGDGGEPEGDEDDGAGVDDEADNGADADVDNGVDDDAGDDAASDDADADDGAEADADDEAADDAELAADEGEEDGGGDTILMLSVIVAMVLMFASFGLIRREGSN